MSQIIKKPLFLSFLLLAFLLNGCATKAYFKNIPVDSAEFKKDMSTLKSTYPTIEEYSTPSISAALLPYTRPDITELKKQWGNPSEEKTVWNAYVSNIALIGGLIALGQLPTWCLALPFIAVPTPPKNYIWDKEKYHINIYAVRSLFSGYFEKIASWKWEIKKSE